MKTVRRVIAYVRSLPILYSIGGAVVIVALLLVGVHALTRPPADTAAAGDTTTHVRIASVSSLAFAICLTLVLVPVLFFRYQTKVRAKAELS
jgi:hypothetical protein